MHYSKYKLANIYWLIVVKYIAQILCIYIKEKNTVPTLLLLRSIGKDGKMTDKLRDIQICVGQSVGRDDEKGGRILPDHEDY